MNTPDTGGLDSGAFDGAAESGGPDGAADSASDGAVDSGTDGAVDSGDDGAADSGGPDGATDSGNDGAADSGGPDAAPDAGPLTGDGCAGGACQNPTCKPLGTPVDPGMYPQLGFEVQPSYIPNDTIILTLDDIPDAIDSPPDPVFGTGGWTTQDLAFLATVNMHVDTFLNTNDWCGDVLMDPTCTQALVDVLRLHNPGNHTVHHVHMGSPSTPGMDPPDGCNDAASCDAEVAGVETVVNMLSNGGRPHLTRFRAPYGEPYQVQGPGLAMVEGVVARYAVQVGWNLDSGDSACASPTCAGFTGQSIAQNVETLVGPGPGKGGSWGILLMHGVYPWTHDALPLLFGPNGYLTKAGFKLATVEDAICWKFGKHSWEIVQQGNPGETRGPN